MYPSYQKLIVACYHNKKQPSIMRGWPTVYCELNPPTGPKQSLVVEERIDGFLSLNSSQLMLDLDEQLVHGSLVARDYLVHHFTTLPV